MVNKEKGTKIWLQMKLNTKTLGPVRIVKQDTKDYGSSKLFPGKVRVRVLESNIIEWIDENELIIPPPKKPMTGKEKKAKSDQYYKDMGYKTMTFKISPENYEKCNALKKNNGLSNWNDVFNFIIEKH